MAEVWVLYVLWMGTSRSLVFSHEHTSLERCEAAGREITASMGKYYYFNQYTFFCKVK